ncbi:putative lipopolysaccharide heptosyltransferase III [Campylobacter corcagiensis]|uniref:Putative lipopolysaccharide heptosyltransferase III n=1 Tax=Campylobacter corcagiensis TaxID=1448857 RepID=A0A7M1LFD4_9BACT|nr:putative lipopolysaccharide heptosyltransferase III [Campylobacter corcagiensis]QKF65077.1 heptosyltransferase III [Campylobacter corcagiensis]QOQ86774.1 putative lipopolysaccharide heptosyltransferase III [Campylobacter corcagiensis]
MKILVIKFRNIGDTLLASPVVSNLKLNYPDATIDFALNSGCEAMISGNPNINKIHIYDRFKIKNSNFIDKILLELEFAKNIKKQNYDIAINLTTGDRGIWIAKFAGIKKIVGMSGKNRLTNTFITDKIPKFSDFKHIVDQNLDALKALNLEIFNKKVEVFSDENLEFLNLPNKFIHIHATSRWMFKCVNDDIMANIIDFCENDLNIKVVLTGDNNQNELDKLKNILSLCKANPINLAGKLNLKQVIKLSKLSSLYIGVDTAIMHIAAANDTPCIAFFGPSGAYEWGPWDNWLLKSGYTKQNGIQTMGKHIVFQKDWEFVPCDKDGIIKHKVENRLMDFSDEMNLIKQKIVFNLNNAI